MDSEKYGFRLTQKAEEDLDEIVAYLYTELSNPKAAEAFLDKFQSAVDEACSFPESGSPVLNEFLPQTQVRKKVLGSYILYYVPEAAKRRISVLRIIYGRRNTDEILRWLDNSIE